MDIKNLILIPARIGFHLDEESNIRNEVQQLFDWHRSIRLIIRKHKFLHFSGAALHFLKEKEFGGQFHDDVTYVDTDTPGKQLWVLPPTDGILITFAFAGVTIEQIRENELRPTSFGEEILFPPVFVVEFIIADGKAIAKSSLRIPDGDFPKMLLYSENFFKMEGDWQQGFDFIDDKLYEIKERISKLPSS